MPNPIPQFDHNGVIPPHVGDPRLPADLSPYPCTTLELCQRFGNTAKRRDLLGKFLDFRARLNQLAMTTGFQWLDGSFTEDVENRDGRDPNDLDVVTVYWGYDLAFQQGLVTQFPAFADPWLAKADFSLDHYPFDAGHAPELTVEWTRYWISLFSHNRDGVWKGMLRVDLATPQVDLQARQELANRTA